MKEKPTVFIVSQRAASIRFADQIIVLDEGEMAGIGTHAELLESCPAYQADPIIPISEGGSVKWLKRT